MLKIVLASHNKGKVAEIKAMLSDLLITLISAAELNIPDIEETGDTFKKNAIIKARNAAAFSGLPAIADDSGLAIEALDGAPGIYSARYAGENATDLDRINKALSALKDTPSAQRNAAFHCAIAFVKDADDPSPLVCEGIWPGEILNEPRGEKGFGYDPIFYVPAHQCSAAELEPTIKNSISHRALAMQQFKKQLQDLLVKL